MCQCYKTLTTVKLQKNALLCDKLDSIAKKKKYKYVVKKCTSLSL